jgi:hypothetical protein
VVDVEVPATPPRVVAPFGGEGSLQEVVFRVDKFLQPGRGRGEKRKMKVGGLMWRNEREGEHAWMLVDL